MNKEKTLMPEEEFNVYSSDIALNIFCIIHSDTTAMLELTMDAKSNLENYLYKKVNDAYIKEEPIIRLLPDLVTKISRVGIEPELTITAYTRKEKAFILKLKRGDDCLSVNDPIEILGIDYKGLFMDKFIIPPIKKLKGLIESIDNQ